MLRNRPWFVGVWRWKSNFKPSEANLSAVAVWIRLDIGNAIGLVLRVDTHTASESKGKFARLCVQLNLDEPLVNLIRVGGIRQQVQYEGLGSLCFSCGRMGHQAVGCPYKVQPPANADSATAMEESLVQVTSKTKVRQDERAFGPWTLVTRKWKPGKKMIKGIVQQSQIESLDQSLIRPNSV